MEIPALIEPFAGNGYRAKSGEPFALAAEGATRDEGLRNLKDLIARRLADGAELVSVNVVGDENPWTAMAGTYDPDDPMVKVWIEDMAENRRRDDEGPDYPWMTAPANPADADATAD